MVTESWRLQGGLLRNDFLVGATVGPNGSSVLAGYTNVNSSVARSPSRQWVAAKLDGYGALQWRWQGGTSGSVPSDATAMGKDGSVVMVGSTHDESSDFAAVKLDADGSLLWERQGGSDANDRVHTVALAGDGSVILAGSTTGAWSEENIGLKDFAASKLDSDGNLVWTWQDGTEEHDSISAVVIDENDASVVLAGYSSGNWSGIALGRADFAAVKLDADGNELWRWQSGTVGFDACTTAAMGEDGSVVLAGMTSGVWNSPNAGGYSDFAAVKLDIKGEEIWRWQGRLQPASGPITYPDARNWTTDMQCFFQFRDTRLAGRSEDSVSATGAQMTPALDAGGLHVIVLPNRPCLSSYRSRGGGTTGTDVMRAAAMGGNGSVVLAGTTNGLRPTPRDKRYVVTAVNLHEQGTEVWRWQGGTSEAIYDIPAAIAAGFNCWMVLAESTAGAWTKENTAEYDLAAVILELSASFTVSPCLRFPFGAAVHAMLVPTPKRLHTTRTRAVTAETLAPLPVVASPPTRSPVPTSPTGLDSRIRSPALSMDTDALAKLATTSKSTDVPETGSLVSSRPYVTRATQASPAPTPGPTSPAPTSPDSSTVLDIISLQPIVGLPSLPLNSHAPISQAPSSPTPSTPAPSSPAPSAPFSPAPSASFSPPPSASFSPPPSASFSPAPSALFSPVPSASFSPAPSRPAPSSPAPLLSPAPSLAPTSPAPTTSPTPPRPTSAAPTSRAPASRTTSVQPVIVTLSPVPESEPSAPGITFSPLPVGATHSPGVNISPGSQSQLDEDAPFTPGPLLTDRPTQMRLSPSPVTPELRESTSGNSILPMIIGSVSAAATVAIIVAGVCLRKKRKAMKTGSVQKVTHSELATSGNASNGIIDQRSSPRVSGFAEEFAGLPSYLNDSSDRAVNSATSGEVGKSVETPHATETRSQAAPARGIKEVAVVDALSVATRADQEKVPPDNAIPLLVGPTVSPAGNEVAKAVVEAARNLAMQSHFPGVSEAATLVSILVNLVSDDTCSAEVESRVKRCRLVVMMLQRASMVLGQGNDINGDMERMLIEDVQTAVADMVELIKTYRSKGRLSQVLVSTMFRRRMEETEAVIDRAISDLKLGLHVHAEIKQEEDRQSVHSRNELHSTTDQLLAASMASARRRRRQRNLDQIEIPEEHVTISKELLGKGGWGEVYIADYNGRNAAAKVIRIDFALCDLRRRQGNSGRRITDKDDADANRKCASFLLELQTMIRLRSPHTVNVYGAITARKDRLVLVMELLTGGDLRSFLRHTDTRLTEAQARQIIEDVCAGMAFLHSKNVIHGDLKSPNILLDGEGRAKIADFGTSRWAQHGDTTGLATHKTTTGNVMQMMSFAWAAPEVLESIGSSYASDVYSFGIVAWEVLSRKVPWADEVLPRDIYRRVVFQGARPQIPADVPADIASIMHECWAGPPKERPASSEILERLRSRKSEG